MTWKNKVINDPKFTYKNIKGIGANEGCCGYYIHAKKWSELMESKGYSDTEIQNMIGRSTNTNFIIRDNKYTKLYDLER